MGITPLSLRLRRLLLGTSALTGFALASTAQAGQAALPTNGVVTVGSATIAQPNANQLNITTATSRTVIDWQSFSIGNGNKVAIQQPGSSSITVNEVTGSDPSQIFGDLSSNGRVVLANPNGIWFGPNSHVDVAGLVASTATLSADAKKAFAAGGRLSLDTAGNSTASIQNDGHITIASEGLAALVAPGVRNNGVIEATLGSVTLASGETSTLDFYGDGLVSLAVTSPVQALAIGPDGKPFQATIENKGKIAAQHVLVTADVVKGVVDNSINMSGVVEAKGVTVSGGDIVLDGGDGAVTVAGTLDATSQQAQGGNIAVTGGAVTLAATAKLDASGAKGGGTVQVGGGPHGSGTLRHATSVLVQGGSAILANATVQGDGGTVSVWSDGLTTFGGSIQAKGAGTGNGGWVETSGHDLSITGGRVDTSAPFGQFGTWLLDPTDVDIVHSSSTDGSASTTSYTDQTPIYDSDLNYALMSTDVTVAASGNLTVDTGANVSWTTGQHLTLDTSAGSGNIAINGTINGPNGTLTLKTSSTGTVSQTAAFTVSGLELVNGIFNLNTVANAVNVLAGNGISINLDDDGLTGGASLTIGNVGSTTGLSATGAVAVSAMNAGTTSSPHTGGITNTSPVTGSTISLTTGNGGLAVQASLGNGTSQVTLNTTGIATQTSPITASTLQLLGAGGDFELTGSGNYFQTLAANTGTLNILDGVSTLSINTAGSTTGIATTGATKITTQSGSVEVNANVQTGGNFIVALNGNDHFTEFFGATITAIGAAEIYDTNSSASTITISGGITASGIDIESTSPTGSINGGSGLTIGATANIHRTGPATGDGPGHASLVLYSGGNNLTLNEGASIIADAGNIAFITGNFQLNTPSAVSTISTPGTVIYSPPDGSFTGPVLNLSGNAANITFSGSMPIVQLLTNSGGSLNQGTIGSLQFGFPTNNNTTSVSGTFSLPIATTFYGATTFISSMFNPLSDGATITAAGNLTLSAGRIDVTAPITLTTAGSTLNLQAVSALNISANISLSGPLYAGVGPGGSVTQMAGSTIVDTADPVPDTLNQITNDLANVVIYESSNTGAGATIDILGSISASGIYVLAADHKASSVQSGTITIDTGAHITNTVGVDPLEPNLVKNWGYADTIFFTGPGGTLNINSNAVINGGIASVAFLADTVNIADTSSMISTASRVIISPATTDGYLKGGPGVSLPDPYPNPAALIDLQVPGGGSADNIAIGTAATEPYTVTQQMINFFSGADVTGTAQSPVGRLEIGLSNSSATMTFRGATTYLAETSFNAENIVVSGTATVTASVSGHANLSGVTTFDDNNNVQVPNALLFNQTENGGPNGSSISFAAGSVVSNPNGVVQLGSSCMFGCTVAPTATLAGSINAAGILYFPAAAEDSGYPGDIVTIATGAVLQATGTPQPTNPHAISGIVLQTGRGGSLTIASGATLNAGAGEVDLYTDSLSFGGTPTAVTAALINVDTGTAGMQAYPDVSDIANQEVPTITLGAATGPLGLALSTTTLGQLATFAGSTPVLIGDELRLDTNNNPTLATPVAINVAGSVTLPTNTTIAGTAVTQASGTTITAGSLTINTYVPTNLPASDTQDENDTGEAPPVTIPTSNGVGLSISASNSVTINATLAESGIASIGVGPGGTFTEAQGASLTSSTGVVIYETSTTGGATLNINGAIQAPEIYLLASDHQSNQSGQITLGGTAVLHNGNSNGDADYSYTADTILYAGPGGGITMGSGALVQGVVTNVALIADTLTLNNPTISTFGRVIVAPASTDGELRTDGTVALPDAFATAPNYLLDFAAPAGVTSLATIGIGTGTGTYQLNQATITALTGVPVTRSGATVMSVARFQIGLPGSSNVENLAGSVSFGTEFTDFASAFTFASSATISIPSSSVQTFDTDGQTDPTTGIELTTPSGAIFVTDLTSTAPSASLNLPSGASITVPGNIQLGSNCYATTCTVVPTATIGGALNAGASFIYQGSGNDVVTVAPSAIIAATGAGTAGGMEFIAGNLKLGGVLTTNDGEIDFDTNVALQGTTPVQISSGGADIDFNGTLVSQTSRQTGLILSAGSTGNINFNGLVGNNGQLGAVAILSADNVTGPAVNSTSLSNGTSEFQAASFSAGSPGSSTAGTTASGTAIAGAFTMAGGLSTNIGTNGLASTSSVSSRTSGSIFINAAGAVTIGTMNTTNPSSDLIVSARGADISSSSSNSTSVTGNGGTISITGSSVTLAGITARGGQSKSGSVAVASGGNGGSIFLDATNGNVTIQGGYGDPGVAVDGGQSMLTTGGVGGNAGTIVIDASGNVTLPGAYATGGSVLGGVGGTGGSILINAATIALGRAIARGGDTQATGTGAGGGAGGSVTLIASDSTGNPNAIMLGGNNSDFSGLSTSVTYGSLSARSGETGVTDVFNTDVGGTVVNAGGTILIEGSTQGAALTGAIELFNTTPTGGSQAPSVGVDGGTNVVISASGAAGMGGLIDVRGSIVAADDGVESLRLGAGNGVVNVAGSIGTPGGNRLAELLFTANAGAITIGGSIVTDALVDTRTSGSLTVDGDLKLGSYTTPLGNSVVLSFPNQGANGNGNGNGSGSGSGGLSSVSLAGTFLLTTPVTLAGNAVTLTGTTVFDSSAGNGSATFGTIDGAFGLTINTGTGTVTAGTIGANTALSSLTITGSKISLGSVTTTGAQTYTGATTLSGTYTASAFDVAGAATLAGTSTVTAATAIFGGTIDGTSSGAQSMTINASTSGELDGAVGGSVPLNNFTFNAATITGSVPSIFVTGTEMINLPGAFYSGNYSFTNFINTGSMVLTGDTVITATAGNISIGGTVDGAHALSLTDLAGTITIGGVIGGGTALTSLTLTSNNAIVLGGKITTTGAQSYTGPVSLAGTIVGGSVGVTGATTLTGAATITTSGNITFGGTVDGAQALVLNAGSAAVALQGAAGAQTALGGLAVTAGTISLGSVATSGAQSYTGTLTTSGIYSANGFTVGGPMVLAGNTAINSGSGDMTFASTVNGQFALALSSNDANVFFDGTLGTTAARISLLSVTGIDNLTVLNNSSLFVHDFTASKVFGTLTFGNHSLESDDVVTIQATSVDGRVISSTSTTINANTVTGTIQGSTVTVNATGAVNAAVTGDSATINADSFSGSVAATRSANIAATNDVSATVTVSGGSASVSGANVSGSVTATGLAQIAATQNVSADVTGGSVAIAATGGTVSGAVTSTGGSVTIAAGNVSSTIVAQGGGSVDVTASGSITGSVQGGAVSLTAPVVNASLNAASANISSESGSVTGTIGGNDAASVVGVTNNVTQTVLGATRQLAGGSGGDNGQVTGGDEGGDATTADGESTDDKKKKAKDKGAVYDYANQYIDNLISGKPAH